jgi:restriction system protein
MFYAKQVNMESGLIHINYRQEVIGVRTFRIKYTAEIFHSGLNEYKIVSSDDEYILQTKVNSQTLILENKWAKFIQNTNSTKNKELADKQTQDAIIALKEVDNILKNVLITDSKIEWHKLKDRSQFKIPNPIKNLHKILADVICPQEPKYFQSLPKPEESDFSPNLSFLDKLFKSRRVLKENQANLSFEKAFLEWEKKEKEINASNEKIKGLFEIELKEYDQKIENLKEKNAADSKKWENEKEIFYINQANFNKELDTLKELYSQKEQDAIIHYSELVLENSKYPDSFPKKFEIDYKPESKILIVEYSLPSIEDLPTLNEVKFLKNELKEYHISDTQLAKLFDNTMYNITLRCIYELFQSDVIDSIDSISFNGWVNAINKANGKRENNCILSIQVKKAEFKEIDLGLVDPKTCFKNLKGVASSKLSSLVSIKPILQIDRTDKRFTNHYEVADSLDASTNLASMDWEDFEHLIREVFGKEFSSNGGEVKVTQASRDGGVDAIAFDPDPIKGGKIVIQAKRYTNTVGVSAVRDLYGTVMNEGATKGILVTTADYGPDAYEFAKGKPLTLMNGSNLLYLLEKHGHQARINIREAKDSIK